MSWGSPKGVRRDLEAAVDKDRRIDMTKTKPKVLVLNADYLPLQIKTWKQGFKSIYKARDNGGTYAISYYKDSVLDSKGREHMIPAVVVLHKYVRIAHKHAPYNRRNILCRDRYMCQYCGQKFKSIELTLDHVIPKSKWRSLNNKGTPSRLDNVVLACKPCNNKKDDRTCKEANMYPLNHPKKLSHREALINRFLAEHIPAQWEQYVETIINGQKKAQK